MTAPTRYEDPFGEPPSPDPAVDPEAHAAWMDHLAAMDALLEETAAQHEDEEQREWDPL